MVVNSIPTQQYLIYTEKSNFTLFLAQKSGKRESNVKIRCDIESPERWKSLTFTYCDI